MRRAGIPPELVVHRLHRRAQPRALRRRSLDERQLRRLAVPRERSCRVSLDLAPLGLGGFTAGAAKKRLLKIEKGFGQRTTFVVSRPFVWSRPL